MSYMSRRNARRKDEVVGQASDLLSRSKSFNALPPERQRQVMLDTEKVFSYIADSGVAQMMGLGGKSRPAARAMNTGDPVTDNEFVGQAGQDFASTVQAVDFPGFCADLIQGVFQAIVDASIQQMEAYAELVANVSKSVDQYMKDNVSEDQARDYLVNQYPDHFQPDMDSGRIAPKPEADPDSAPDFMQDLGLPFDFEDVEDEEAEKELVTSARRRIAMDRQQLLATMVMMGLNRIVVTDGNIKAGVTFDLNAETLDKQKSEYERSFEYNSEHKGKQSKPGFWFIKPKTKSSYKNSLNITTNRADTDETERSLDMKIKMTGNVDLRFKSDYFPMEKMTEIFGLDQETITTTSRQGATGGNTASGDPAEQLRQAGIDVPGLGGS